MIFQWARWAILCIVTMFGKTKSILNINRFTFSSNSILNFKNKCLVLYPKDMIDALMSLLPFEIVCPVLLAFFSLLHLSMRFLSSEPEPKPKPMLMHTHFMHIHINIFIFSCSMFNVQSLHFSFLFWCLTLCTTYNSPNTDFHFNHHLAQYKSPKLNKVTFKIQCVIFWLAVYIKCMRRS